MSQDQRLRQVASALREKASQFDVNKEKSKKQIKSCISTLRDLINIVEADLLRKVDSIFGHNLFAVALAEVEGYNGNGFIDYNKLEKASKEPVPPVTGPSQEAFSEAKKAVLELCDFERRAVPLRVSGRATSFDSIELSWSSVPSAVTYQVESRRPSDSAFSKIYEGNNLSYTVAGLGPETRYLFHLRSVFGDGSVSEWSEVIKIATQEVPVLCNVTANALSWNTVSVSWSPVPAEGLSYRVCVMENARNETRSCVVDCGQNTWYRPSGL